MVTQVNYTRDYYTPIYVIGIQEGGGSLLTNSHCYTDYKLVETHLARLHAEGLTFLKIFTLYPVTGITEVK